MRFNKKWALTIYIYNWDWIYHGLLCYFFVFCINYIKLLNTVILNRNSKPFSAITEPRICNRYHAPSPIVIGRDISSKWSLAEFKIQRDEAKDTSCLGSAMGRTTGKREEQVKTRMCTWLVRKVKVIRNCSRKRTDVPDEAMLCLICLIYNMMPFE